MLAIAVLNDGVEIEDGFLKGNLGILCFLCRHLENGSKNYHCYDNGFLHGLLVLVMFVVFLFRV